jgi:hypothetical protein
LDTYIWVAGGPLILDRCRAFDLFASVDAHLCPQGVLQILVSEARHLMKKDHSLAGGKSDPYITISIGEKKISFVDRVGSQSKE